MTENPSAQLLIKSSSGLPSIAIVGRTNVGKSSLFNRLVGRRESIVQSERGTTRDRVKTVIYLAKTKLELIDTGGFSFSKEGEFVHEINREVEKALEDANLILFVCDGKAGIHAQDELFADRLRKRRNKQVILVVNKLDGIEQFSEADQFYKFGFLNLAKISALHGLGISELTDLILQKLPEMSGLEGAGNYHFSLSIIGEPNSGKSTYFNALLKEERAIVSTIPGTTRDVIQEIIEYQGKRLLLRDTAGIRPLKSNHSPIEQFSISRSKDAVRHSEIILFLADGYKGFGQTSKKIIQFISECKKPCILIVNKWDLVKKFEQAKYIDLLHKRVPFVRLFPVVFISAKTQRNILKPMDEALRVYEKYITNLKTHDLNIFLTRFKKMHILHEPVKLKFLTQIRNSPPHFLLLGKRTHELKESTVQFIKHQIQEYFSLLGTPIELTTREEKE